MLITKLILLTISHLNTNLFVSVNPTVTDNDYPCKSDTVAYIYYNHAFTDHDHACKSETVPCIYHNHAVSGHDHAFKSDTVAGTRKELLCFFSIQETSDKYLLLKKFVYRRRLIAQEKKLQFSRIFLTLVFPLSASSSNLMHRCSYC